MKMTPSLLILGLACCIVATYAQRQCGRTQYSADKRIVGGEVSRDAEWPWLLSVMVSFNGAPREHVCGATLIRPQWAVSGAHCFHTPLNESLSDNAADYTIRIGEYNLYDNDADHIDVIPTLIVKNAYDAPTTFIDDIALIKLPNPVELNDRVNVACLPGATDTYPASCTVAGWGHQQDGGDVSPVIRHVEVDLVDSATCSNLYISMAQYLPDFSGIICAGDTTDGGRDACQYDSGGPLVCYNDDDDRWVLAAVVSGGKECGLADFPGVYTDVQHYLQWIDDTIAANP